MSASIPPAAADEAGRLAERVTTDDVERALRTYEQFGGALRYLEKDKWHLCDKQAMAEVLKQDRAGRLVPSTPTQSEDARTLMRAMLKDKLSGHWTQSKINEITDIIATDLLTRFALVSTPTPPAPSRDAVEAMKAKALEQISYWQERMSKERYPEEGISEDGETYTPIGDDAALKAGYCNGWYSSSHWWLQTLDALAATQAPAEPSQGDRVEKLEDVLRGLASYLGAGGYNAETVDPDIFDRKIRDGIDMLAASWVEDAKRYRKLRGIGAAPGGTLHLDEGLVMVATNLDAWLDEYLTRGIPPAPSYSVEFRGQAPAPRHAVEPSQGAEAALRLAQEVRATADSDEGYEVAGGWLVDNADRLIAALSQSAGGR